MADPGSGSGGPDAASQAAGEAMGRSGGGQDRSGMQSTLEGYQAGKAEADKQEKEVLAKVEKAVSKAIALGINPYSDTFQNVLAANMMRGKFGNISSLLGPKFGDDTDTKKGKTKGGITQTDEVKGFIAKYAPTTGDKIKSALGLTDIKATLTPGQKTPLGGAAGILGLLDVPGKMSIGIGNQLAGFLGIGVNPVTQAVNQQIAASNQALAAQKGKAPQSVDIQKYTGRPDDAVKQRTPQVGEIFSAGGKNYIAGVNGPIALSGVPEQKVQTAQPLAAEGTLRTPDEMYGMLTQQLAPTLSPFTQDYALTAAPLSNPSGIQNVNVFSDAVKSITDGVKSIPGGYQIGDRQYRGTYQENPSARTFSKTEEEYVAPFSAEMFKQGISTLNPFD